MNVAGRNFSKTNIRGQQKKTTREAAGNGDSTWVWLVLALIVITTVIIYYKAVDFGFLNYWDDNGYVKDNSHITGLAWKNIKLFFSEFYVGNYQPVTILSYAADYKIGAGQAAAFHFTNILFHILNTCLVFVFIRRISPASAVVALITAGFFAVHPMHVESVAWVSERKDVLYSFFFLLSLIMYAGYLKSKKIIHLVYSALFFLLSCMSKSAAVVLPLIMFLVDYYGSRKFSRGMILEKIPFFAVSLLFGVVAVWSQKSTGVMQDWAPDMSVAEHLSIVCFSFVSYLFHAFVPLRLSAIYPYQFELSGSLPVIYYLSVAFAGGLLFFMWYSRRWGKDVIFGFLFFIITIVLVLQIIPVGGATMADRYSYMPFVGIFFIAGKLIERFSAAGNPGNKHVKYSFTVLAAVFFVFSYLAHARVKVWENDDTLFSDVIVKYPTSSAAYLNRGIYYKNYYGATVYANDKLNREIWVNLAIRDFENAIKFELIPKNNWKAWFNLGMAKGELGDFGGAVSNYDKSIGLYPYNRYAFLYRGVYLLNYFANTLYADDKTKRDLYARMAVRDFENALKLTSVPMAKVDCFNNIGIAKVLMGDYAGAARAFDSVIRIDGNNIEAYRKRGNARYLLKNYRGALEDCNKIIEMNPQDAEAIKNRNFVMSVLAARGA